MEHAKDKEKGTPVASKELSHKLQRDQEFLADYDKRWNQGWTEWNNGDMMRKLMEIISFPRR